MSNSFLSLVKVSDVNLHAPLAHPPAGALVLPSYVHAGVVEVDWLVSACGLPAHFFNTFRALRPCFATLTFFANNFISGVGSVRGTKSWRRRVVECAVTQRRTATIRQRISYCQSKWWSLHACKIPKTCDAQPKIQVSHDVRNARAHTSDSTLK